MNKKNKNSGMSILGVVVFLFVLVLILSYFGISLKSVFESPAGQENVGYTRGVVERVWVDYVKPSFHRFWETFTKENTQQ